MRKILVMGATSAIAQATNRLFAQDGDYLFLVARNREKLESISADLALRGAGRVITVVQDANATEGHAALVKQAAQALGGLDTLLVAHGLLPDQKQCQASWTATRQALETNALSILSLLTHGANHFEAQGHGTIAVISSVAGDRGRQSNYVYGAAKAMVSTFLQGLRNRLHASGVTVVTIKPGFVDTPMTASYSKGLLWAQPEQVARDIHEAVVSKREICYTPWFWRWIMWVIQHLPEWLFKRLSL
ncbi:MAG: SDR family oxidoreductase [Magnetococcales bacterium]|nr:SDR family oxidoreductase [Magnetococcales bacterium]